MSTADNPPLREDPPLSSEVPDVDEMAADTEGAPGSDSAVPASAPNVVEELVKLRANVQERLQAVVAGEQQLRQRTQELRQRLAPIRKQIDTLTKTLQLDTGTLASLRNAAAAEVQQQVAQLRTLTVGLDEETRLRLAMTEAGRLRLRQIDGLTLRPVETWKRGAATWNQSISESKEVLTHQLDEFSARWSSAGDTEASTAADESGGGVDDNPPTEPADSGEAAP